MRRFKWMNGPSMYSKLIRPSTKPRYRAISMQMLKSPNNEDCHVCTLPRPNVIIDSERGAPHPTHAGVDMYKVRMVEPCF